MIIIAKSKSEKEVGKALEGLVTEINKELVGVNGLISDIDCEVTVGPLEASVSVCVFIEGDEPRHKFLIGVNEKGFSRENSMKKAERRINSWLGNKGGRIAGSYIKSITSLPGRVYTTLILAVNEDMVEDPRNLDTENRRKRIKKALENLGNDPTVLNVARLAGIFGISRPMIYKDLESMGYKRG